MISRTKTQDEGLAHTEDDPDARLRAVFGQRADEEPPRVDGPSLRAYHRFLSEQLTFPFLAIHTVKISSTTDRQTELKITGLLGLDEVLDLEKDGLFCRCRNPAQFKGSSTIVKLADLQVKGRKDPNRPLLEDYRSWFGKFW